MTFAAQASAQDVWFCQGEEFAAYSSENSAVQKYKVENFKFTVYPNGSLLVFGQGGFFDNSKSNVSSYNGNVLNAKGQYDHVLMVEGHLIYTAIGPRRGILITANCDRF